MSEQVCEVLENATVQQDLSLGITACHNVPCCTQCRDLEGEEEEEKR